MSILSGWSLVPLNIFLITLFHHSLCLQCFIDCICMSLFFPKSALKCCSLHHLLIFFERFLSGLYFFSLHPLIVSSLIDKHVPLPTLPHIPLIAFFHGGWGVNTLGHCPASDLPVHFKQFGSTEEGPVTTCMISNGSGLISFMMMNGSSNFNVSWHYSSCHSMERIFP